MVNRALLLRQLQKPQKGLRRRVPPRNTSGPAVLLGCSSHLAGRASVDAGLGHLDAAASPSFSTTPRRSLDEVNMQAANAALEGGRGTGGRGGRQGEGCSPPTLPPRKGG
jgi:hypothetical protein